MSDRLLDRLPCYPRRLRSRFPVERNLQTPSTITPPLRLARRAKDVDAEQAIPVPAVEHRSDLKIVIHHPVSDHLNSITPDNSPAIPDHRRSTRARQRDLETGSTLRRIREQPCTSAQAHQLAGMPCRRCQRSVQAAPVPARPTQSSSVHPPEASRTSRDRCGSRA